MMPSIRNLKSMAITSRRYLMMTMTAKETTSQMSVTMMKMKKIARVRKMVMTLDTILKIHLEMARIQAVRLSSAMERARTILCLTPVTMTAKPLK